MPEDNVEARLSTLEQEVAQLRDRLARTSSTADAAHVDAGAARVLAAGADRDVSEVRAELRAHTHVLNALREDQLALREDQLALRKTQLEQGQEMRAGFAALATGMTQITALLTEIQGSE